VTIQVPDIFGYSVAMLFRPRQAAGASTLDPELPDNEDVYRLSTAFS